VSETRKIAAIMVADVVGYSRLAGVDEDRTLARLRAQRSDLIDPTISVHHGRIVKRTGDGSVIEFRSVVDAVRCALEVQHAMVERNIGLPPERRTPRHSFRGHRRGGRRRSDKRRRKHGRAGQSGRGTPAVGVTLSGGSVLLVVADAAAQIADPGHQAHLRNWRLVRARFWKNVVDLSYYAF
jgi:hypothetical protein